MTVDLSNGAFGMTAITDGKDVQRRRRGKVVYEKNPFVSDAVSNTRNGIKRISNTTGDRMMVVNGSTGEIVAPAGFWQAQEVDRTQFVKLYINGVKAFRDLSGSGTRVFELLYVEVQKNPGRDRVFLSFPAVDQVLFRMSESTFMRGMKELVDKEFIAATPVPGWYFLNPDYMWNGDRLAFVREYRVTPQPKARREDDNGQNDQALLEARGQQRLPEIGGGEL